MKKQLILLAGTVVFIFLMSSCASLTGFEEGRTVGKDNSELTISGNFTRVPDLFDDDDEIFDTLSVNNNISFPNLEAAFKYGITDKFDIGIRASTNFNLSTYMKYQVVGDKSSSFALSPGFEIGTILGAAYNIGIPIYASYYPTDNVAINVTPRFMYQFITGNGSNGASYIGGNFGLMFGKRNKFGLDIGVYNVGSDLIGSESASQSLITIGVGGKFKFGDSDNSSSGRN